MLLSISNLSSFLCFLQGQVQRCLKDKSVVSLFIFFPSLNILARIRQLGSSHLSSISKNRPISLNLSLKIFFSSCNIKGSGSLLLNSYFKAGVVDICQASQHFSHTVLFW